ncbi:MAG: SUMF1/EgtB/PvdO family nonheme iron enzyme [Phycisphaerae bacterium]|nr:SUMF1/EgtB/PvdO family nonheme iron enzyme [Phycisphaerae bacterium]
MYRCICAITAVIVLSVGPALAVNIETVPVGNAGNAGEWSGESYGGYGPDRVCGAVDYTYNIGKYQVTARQYTEFLNKVAGVDAYNLYHPYMWSWSTGCKIERFAGTGTPADPYQYRVDSEWADRPVNYVNWGDAARFANWLTNSQPTGTLTGDPAQDAWLTEDGSYSLDGATTNAELLAVTREPDARWVIPSEDEWYKAAYHKNDGVTGDYWDYPTSSDTVNTSMANYGGSVAYTTAVGSYAYSSPYGTYDQGGNLQEWNEAIVLDSQCILRGGAFNSSDSLLHAAYRHRTTPTNKNDNIGFRVVQVPEPATIVMLALAGLGICRRRRT